MFENASDGWRGAVLTIGNFDGVHRGHQAILTRAAETAKRLSTRVVAMTFDPHPIAILAPDHAPPILTPLEDKLGLLRDAGADEVLVVPIDRDFLDITAEEFVRKILIQRFAPKAIVEGPTFNFGRDRAGSNETLRRFANEGGYEVDVVEAKQIKMPDGKVLTVSSSTIRSLLAAGNVVDAFHCLHRSYYISGRVVHGTGTGKSLGFPTINLEVQNQLVPGEGVYEGIANIRNSASRAAISIGRRETFGGSRIVVEAFLLDVDQSIYDQTALLAFHRRIRNQERFESPEALAAQIGRDVASIRANTSVWINPAVLNLSEKSKYEFAARTIYSDGFRGSVGLFTHVRPDGDALGSTVGLWRVLRDLKCDPKLILYEDVPPRYAFVTDGIPYFRWGKDLFESDINDFWRIVVLDTSSWQQLEPVSAFLKNERRAVLVVDHHKTKDHVSDIELIDENAPAAALMVWKICKAAGWPVSKQAAEALFVGLATDTGWFRFSNTNAEALAAAAEMTALGVNPAELYQRIYLSDPAARVRLIARVLGDLKLFASDRVALQTLSRTTLAECGATDAMTEEIVNEPMRIATVNVSIFCSESADGGPVRVNLRSKHGVDVAALARRFGGGGHERAAGARIAGTLDAVAKQVVDAAVAELRD